MGVKIRQQELPIRARRRRTYTPSARRFFALGELLRRQVEAERENRLHQR
jgi:hypothetical protein